MPSRRSFFAVLGAFVSFVALQWSNARGETPPAFGTGLPKSFDLKKQLELGLKVRKPSEFAYIASIVAKVENGTLPRTLVDQSFLYARGRSGHYPLIYFQFTLKELAKKAGVVL